MDKTKTKEKLDVSNFAINLATYLCTEELLANHISSKPNLESIKPKAKRLYESIEEYNKYAEDAMAWDKEVDSWNAKYRFLQQDKEGAENAIIKMIPPNTWIKTTWEDQSVWIGYCTSNWNGGTRALQVIFSEPTKMLSHTDYE